MIKDWKYWESPVQADEAEFCFNDDTALDQWEADQIRADSKQVACDRSAHDFSLPQISRSFPCTAQCDW